MTENKKLAANELFFNEEFENDDDFVDERSFEERFQLSKLTATVDTAADLVRLVGTFSGEDSVEWLESEVDGFTVCFERIKLDAYGFGLALVEDEGFYGSSFVRNATLEDWNGRKVTTRNGVVTKDSDQEMARIVNGVIQHHGMTI